jgi:hypothetical protein
MKSRLARLLLESAGWGEGLEVGQQTPPPTHTHTLALLRLWYPDQIMQIGLLIFPWAPCAVLLERSPCYQ